MTWRWLLLGLGLLLGVPVAYRILVAVARRYGTDDTPMGTHTYRFTGTKEAEEADRQRQEVFWRRVESRERAAGGSERENVRRFVGR